MNDPNDFYKDKWEKIESRYHLIISWLTEFKTLSKELLDRDLLLRDEKTIEEMALTVNTAYWIRYQKIFKNYVRSKDGTELNIRMSKIISGLELTIIDQRPFVEETNVGSLLNAEFAMFVSTNLMCTWHDFDQNTYNDVLARDEDVQKFLEDHKTWLINLQPEFEYPVHLNSQVWALYIKIIKTLLQREA